MDKALYGRYLRATNWVPVENAEIDPADIFEAGYHITYVIRAKDGRVLDRRAMGMIDVADLAPILFPEPMTAEEREYARIRQGYPEITA